MTAPPQVAELIERYIRNRSSYERAEYNEAQLRNEFLGPLFGALGWDVNNELGYAEPYKDVVHEYSLRTVTGITTPDYSFRVGGTRKFLANDPAKSSEAVAKRVAAHAERRKAALAWEEANPGPRDMDSFRREIAPALFDLTLLQMMRATGLSSAYCWRIRRGERVPHPMVLGEPSCPRGGALGAPCSHPRFFNRSR